jgi:hypothetical protein
VIPPLTNRSSPRDYDRELYAARHLIEDFFAKIKQFRATLATRRPRGTSWLPSTSSPASFGSIDYRPPVQSGTADCIFCPTVAPPLTLSLNVEEPWSPGVAAATSSRANAGSELNEAMREPSPASAPSTRRSVSLVVTIGRPPVLR